MDWQRLRTCVAPDGSFAFGVHRPVYRVGNYREKNFFRPLGEDSQGRVLDNRRNFPANDVDEPGAGPVIEISNPFPFRGTTYILQRSADRIARAPGTIALPQRRPLSLSAELEEMLPEPAAEGLFDRLPPPLKLALAVTSSDPRDLVRLARGCCSFVDDPVSGRPTGLRLSSAGAPEISDHPLFEALANNPHLPDDYKEVMVLRPGVQGGSEIVGEWSDPGEGKASHVFEYLRRNSYIPWGHYAANMAHDAVRYRVSDLTPADMAGMRHLYYQRTYLRLAAILGIDPPERRKRISTDVLEALRGRIHSRLTGRPSPDLAFSATLWGWNFGFDYAPTGYRLHASHQQIHQQYAMIPARLEASGQSHALPAYACGDLVAGFCRQYREATGRPFFETYLAAIRSNTRTDGHIARPRSLIVFEDEACLLFVPKAQTSQWELQLMTTGQEGNVIETDTTTRHSLDRAILVAVKILEKMGARMITIFEYSKRFDDPDKDQRLLYSFLPRLPESPGAFSEAQLRWINGHYPEDFAAACRGHLDPILQELEEETSGPPP
ncbi:MAG: hypothetical protein PVG78_12230 [Desulfobacterales bacterium]|jgi:hypothetical protein